MKFTTDQTQRQDNDKEIQHITKRNLLFLRDLLERQRKEITSI